MLPGMRNGTNIVVVMGVAGAGKTTVGARLATVLDWTFLDADTLHPPANIEKMRHGIALTDADREPWLARVSEHIAAYRRAAQPAVIACSALRREYRERLHTDTAVKFVYLKGDYPLLYERLRRRVGHFLKAPLLESQLASLEEPSDATTVDASLPIDVIVQRICDALGLMPPPR